MKPHAALVSVALSFALSGLFSAGSTPNSSCAGPRRTADSAKDVANPTPHVLSVISFATARHRFPVMDEKGLLLTCVAPELDRNSETDVFKDCTLAPGRTLDDVMHSFVQGIHEEQRLRLNEHTQTPRDSDENPVQKSAQK